MGKLPKIVVTAIVMVLFASPPATGQLVETDELVTDRPDFTESAIVVPYGSVQVEGGVLWEKGAENLRSTSGPELLVRWGVADRIELRFGLPDYVDVRNHASVSGFGDGSVGAKIQLGHVGGGWELASVVSVSLPTGESGFGTDGWDPSLILTTARDLGGTWSVGSQVFGELASAGDLREFNWGGTLVLGTSLGGKSPTASFFELAFTSPEEGGTEVSIHHGYTHRLTPLLQLDVHGGVGVTNSAPDVFVGAGVCIRR